MTARKAGRARDDQRDAACTNLIDTCERHHGGIPTIGHQNAADPPRIVPSIAQPLPQMPYSNSPFFSILVNEIPVMGGGEFAPMGDWLVDRHYVANSLLRL